LSGIQNNNVKQISQTMS